MTDPTPDSNCEYPNPNTPNKEHQQMTDNRADAYRTATTLYSELVGEVGGPKDADPAFEVERIANWLLEGAVSGASIPPRDEDSLHRRWTDFAKEAGKWRPCYEALRDDVERVRAMCESAQKPGNSCHHSEAALAAILARDDERIQR